MGPPLDVSSLPQGVVPAAHPKVPDETLTAARLTSAAHPSPSLFFVADNLWFVALAT
jgi:hypothetical protein